MVVLASLDWSTGANLATALGTLILAIATFVSVRSANRSARTAERAFNAGKRPVLFPSHLEDAPLKISWGDSHWAHIPGGKGVVERENGVIYLAISLRNVGSGIAVIHSWQASLRAPQPQSGGQPFTRPPLEEFRPQTRDLYIPSGEISFWQGAVREAEDGYRDMIDGAIDDGQSLHLDVLYSDHEGEQRTISRFLLAPRGESGEWLVGVVRHWNLDGPNPRG